MTNEPERERLCHENHSERHKQREREMDQKNETAKGKKWRTKVARLKKPEATITLVAKGIS